ncbi:MAG: hypothetical protein E7218_01515 [Anaerofustis stercorihominis]|nr:hypothetical protein [Anaerofustis stercorihominis]
MKNTTKIILMIVVYIIIGAVLFYGMSASHADPGSLWVYYTGVYFAGIFLVGMGCVALSNLKTPAKVFWLCILFNGFATFGAMI